jgi:hypothetical protein
VLSVRGLDLRVPASLASLAACAAVVLAATLLAEPGLAEEVKPAEPPRCTCPAPDKPIIATKPKFAEAKDLLDENDEIAALEAIRVALTEVGDGGSYVWHRQHGRLSGVVHPTGSFKDPAGRVCRHIVLIMTVGTATGRAEGIACRLADGRWQLDG